MRSILDKGEEVFVAIAIMVAAMIMFVNVGLRYGLHASPNWTEELVRYIIVWMTFVGSSICVRRHVHPSVTAFVDRLPPNARWIATLATRLAGFGFSLFLTTYGVKLVSSALVFGQKSTAGHWPMFVVYLAVVFGGGLMCVRYFQLVFDAITKGKLHREKR